MMPFDETQEMGRVTPKEIIRSIEKILVAVIVLVLILLFVLFGFVTRLLNNQEDQITRGYIGSARLCDLAKGIGVTEPESCKDPKIAPYRDPNVVRGSSASATASNKLVVLICSLMAASKDIPQTVKDNCGK